MLRTRSWDSTRTQVEHREGLAATRSPGYVYWSIRESTCCSDCCSENTSLLLCWCFLRICRPSAYTPARPLGRVPHSTSRRIDRGAHRVVLDGGWVSPLDWRRWRRRRRREWSQGGYRTRWDLIRSVEDEKPGNSERPIFLSLSHRHGAEHSRWRTRIPWPPQWQLVQVPWIKT